MWELAKEYDRFNIWFNIKGKYYETFWKNENPNIDFRACSSNNGYGSMALKGGIHV